MGKNLERNCEIQRHYWFDFDSSDGFKLLEKLSEKERESKFSHREFVIHVCWLFYRLMNCFYDYVVGV